MSISREKKPPLVNKITHKEIQIIYGLTKNGALTRLTAIRASLKEKPSHTLTVIDFCKIEDITLADFDLLIQRAYAGK